MIGSRIGEASCGRFCLLGRQAWMLHGTLGSGWSWSQDFATDCHLLSKPCAEQARGLLGGEDWRENSEMTALAARFEVW